MPDAGDTWLVLPTYEEAANLEAIVAAALEHLPEGARVLVVDDGSPDGTGEIADRLAAADPAVEVLHRARKEGLGPAYVAGFQRALAEGAALVAQMDADFSHDPADLPRLIEATADADLVLGSRYVAGGRVEEWGSAPPGGQPRRQRLRARRARRRRRRPHRRLQGLPPPRCSRRSIWGRSSRSATRSRSRRRSGRYGRGFRVVEVPITFRDREVGESKMSEADRARGGVAGPGYAPSSSLI